MRIAVVGTGYVGLVAGTCFAEVGNRVTCVDVDQSKIDMLNRGELPIYEPGLKEMMDKAVDNERLRFTTEMKQAVADAQVVFIAVGTPPDEDGSADLKHVLAAARDIAANMQQYTVIVDKSTVPVGTADKVREVVKASTDVEFDVVSNPEFLKEGAALMDFLKPDRVVVGADNERALNIMRDLYVPFVRTNHPIIETDVHSAEMTKYTANAMLATRITFMNEIANLCEQVGADVTAVRRGVGSDSRIGSRFLFPGVGYGGSCFPKDVQAIIRTAHEYDSDLKILEAVEDVNKRQKTVLVRKALRHFGNDLANLKFAVWGLAFKPRTDDMREAPAIETINALLDAGAQVQAYDPEAMSNARQIFGDRITYAENSYAALQDADALLIMTEWSDFREPEFVRMQQMLKKPLIFDGRNLFNPERLSRLGFTYHSIGRATVKGKA